MAMTKREQLDLDTAKIRVREAEAKLAEIKRQLVRAEKEYKA